MNLSRFDQLKLIGIGVVLIYILISYLGVPKITVRSAIPIFNPNDENGNNGLVTIPATQNNSGLNFEQVDPDNPIQLNVPPDPNTQQKSTLPVYSEQSQPQQVQNPESNHLPDSSGNCVIVISNTHLYQAARDFYGRPPGSGVPEMEVIKQLNPKRDLDHVKAGDTFIAPCERINQ